MLKTISILTITCLLVCPLPVQAQDNQGDSLPTIPKEGSPTTSGKSVKVDQSPETEPEKRVLVNPMELIMEREERKKQGNQKNFWVNKKLLNKKDEENSEEATTQTKQEILEGVKANQEAAQESIAETNENLETTSQESEETKASEEVETSKEDEEKQTAKDKSKPVENDRMASGNTDEPDREQQEAQQIQQYQSAIQSIPKAKKPARVWNID